MTPTFFVMGAGVFLAGAWTVALCCTLATRVAGRWAQRLTPRAQAGFWLLVAAAPWVAGVAFLVAALLPSFGLAADHCLAHGSHHPHLCLHHPQALSIPALVLAMIGLVRLAMVGAREARSAWRARQTITSLDSVATVHGDLSVLPGQVPTAFAVGTIHTRIYASRGALELPTRMLDSVLAHERCHVTDRHLLLRLIVRLLGALHVPAMARELDKRLASAQELQADECAARAVGDRLMVAECLLQLARARTDSPLGALAFTDGGVAARIVALSDMVDSRKSWPLALIATIGMLAIGAAIGSPSAVHHAFETTLGWLH